MEALQRQLRAVKKRVRAAKASRTGRAGPRARIPDGARREAVERVAAGETQRSVAEDMGIHVVTLREILKQSGRTPQSQRRLTNEEKGRILELYASGLSAAEVAAITEVNEATVNYFLAHEGVRRPSAHGPNTRRLVLESLAQTGDLHGAALLGGVDPKTARLWAEEAGVGHLLVPKAPGRAQPRHQKIMVDLREQGYSYAQIAKRVDLSPGVVGRYLKSLGLGGKRGGIRARRNPARSAADLRRIMRL